MCNTCWCSTNNAKEIAYRPKLEELALQLYKAREKKRDAEEELAPQIKDILNVAGITKYDGKKVTINLVTPVQQEVNLKKLSGYISLQKLYQNDLLTINSLEKLNSFIRKKGIKIEPKGYLKKGKPYERLDVYLKGKGKK